MKNKKRKNKRILFVRGYNKFKKYHRSLFFMKKEMNEKSLLEFIKTIEVVSEN